MRYNENMAETFYVAPTDSLADSVRKILLVAIVFTGIITLISSIFYFLSQPVIPLMYSLPRPEQALVPKEWIFLFPIVSLTISVLHIFLIGKFKDLDELILKMFAWSTVALQIILSAILIRMIVIIW